jgi:hypothetical protein
MESCTDMSILFFNKRLSSSGRFNGFKERDACI